jgi:hypothetical protein
LYKFHINPLFFLAGLCVAILYAPLIFHDAHRIALLDGGRYVGHTQSTDRRTTMKSLIMYLLGVPVSIILLYNIFF